MDVDHNIFHLGVVHGALGLPAPRLDRGFVGAVDANRMDAFGIDKFVSARVLDPPAHDEVEFLGWGGFLHASDFPVSGEDITGAFSPCAQPIAIEARRARLHGAKAP